MRALFIDRHSGRTLYEGDDFTRADIVLGDRVNIVSDKQFGKRIEITGTVIAVTQDISDLGINPAERRLVVTLATD